MDVPRVSRGGVAGVESRVGGLCDVTHTGVFEVGAPPGGTRVAAENWRKDKQNTNK